MPREAIPVGAKGSFTFLQISLPLRGGRARVGVDENHFVHIGPPSPSSPPTVGRGVSTGDF